MAARTATLLARPLAILPDFLVPSFACAVVPRTQIFAFSTSQTRGYPRDRNKNRGVSALRGTGLRQPLSVSKEPLPKPVLDPNKRSKVEIEEDHGLWGFFNADKTALSTPENDYAHGRSWTVEELRHKSWEDLHRLWWVCVRERNKIATASKERERVKAGYGKYESENRDNTVKRTQQAIKHVLTERWYSWEGARRIATKDPTIDLSGEGPAYQQVERPYVEPVEVHAGKPSA